MTYNSAIHHRRSVRLKNYDYSKNGAYFITICIQNRACLLGEIIDDKMQLNAAGEMIQSVWDEIPQYYTGIEIDAFQIMPNHIHGILCLSESTLSLSDIVHRFKTLTTKKYIDGVKGNNWQPFDGKLWQRNYYEHIIRNEKSLSEIREYIVNNPFSWPKDKMNPANN